MQHGKILLMHDSGFRPSFPDRWMAPEVIRHEPYNEVVDVYSFGEGLATQSLP